MIDNAIVGKNTIIRQPDLVNIYKCIIGEGCKIAAFVEIGEGVTIGDRCKIQAFCFIPWGVSVGNDVFIGPNVVFTNVKYPPSPKEEWLTTVIEDNVSIGAGSRILPGITIGKGSLIGAGSVVTKDVPPGVLIAGIPGEIKRKL